MTLPRYLLVMSALGVTTLSGPAMATPQRVRNQPGHRVVGGERPGEHRFLTMQNHGGTYLLLGKVVPKKGWARLRRGSMIEPARSMTKMEVDGAIEAIDRADARQYAHGWAPRPAKIVISPGRMLIRTRGSAIYEMQFRRRRFLLEDGRGGTSDDVASPNAGRKGEPFRRVLGRITESKGYSYVVERVNDQDAAMLEELFRRDGIEKVHMAEIPAVTPE